MLLAQWILIHICHISSCSGFNVLSYSGFGSTLVNCFINGFFPGTRFSPSILQEIYFGVLPYNVFAEVLGCFFLTLVYLQYNIRHILEC